MYELHTPAALQVLSSGFCDDVLPSPFSKGGKKQLMSVSQGIQCNEAFDEFTDAL